MKQEETIIKPFFYTLLPSAFGALSIVWRESANGTKIYRIFLPDRQMTTERVVQTTYANISPFSCLIIEKLGERIQCFLEGKAIDFELDAIALEICSEFQRKVLLAEYKIPRGWISTYGRIAAKLGIPKGARAIGNALANNPFPIIVPCHRAIGSNGKPGGFQGGTRMKQALLEFEGIKFSKTGNLLTDRIYY